MPLKFIVFPEDGYYIAGFVGAIADRDMLDDYKSFFVSNEWFPGLNELTDLSEVDASQVTADGVANLALMIKDHFQQHKFSPKVAVYAPHDLPCGLARMYSTAADAIETHEVFRDLAEARAWLLATP